MASSGTISNTFRTGYAVRITWTVTGQSIADNTSTVTANVQLVSLGSSYTINSSATKNGSLTVNGTKYTFTFNASLTGNQTKTIFTKTGIVVPHNADGTKSCAFSCSAGIAVTLSGTYYGSVTASGTGAFNTIARASTISSVTESVAVNGTNTCTVNISRKASGFTHTVVWKIGSYSKTNTGVGTSSAYAIPMTWLNAIPDATTGTATVEVTTYNGSTKIGSTVSKTFKITVPSTVVPTFSSVGVADAQTAVYTKFGNMVQNKSKAKLTITAVGAYGSTIKAYKTVFEGKTYTGASPTTVFITKSGTATATITITDSRGRTATTTKTWAVVAYAAPKITVFQGIRCLADGTENYEGTFLKSVLNYSISSVSNKNTATYAIEYKLQSDTTWTALSNGSGYALNSTLISENGFLDINASYDVRLSITDYFTTVRRTIEIPTAFTLLDFNASGHGLAFGKVSEKTDGVEFGMHAYFSDGESPEGAIEIPSGTDLDTLTAYGYYVVPDTAVSGSLLNKPNAAGTSTAVIEVLPGGNAGQIIQRYSRAQKQEQYVFERNYYSKAWGEWSKIGGNGKILWSGGMYMTEGHRINLPEKVSDQQHGIVLIFSRYANGAVADTNFNSFFVPKAFVTEKSGFGNMFVMYASPTFSMIAAKYLYVNNEYISGHADNDAVGTSTATGIAYQNNAFVLRYIIGV